jgi:gamma-glutamylcyclotransferase
MIYYFAYGSNMDQNQMKDRCPDSKLISKAFLKDYKLAFTIFSPKRQCGCADVIKSVGDEVWGLVYEVTKDDLEKLDEFEMHPIKYKRFTTKVINKSGEEIEVETYEVVEKSLEHLKPSKEYFGIIQKAAIDFQFPENYKNSLLTYTVLD